MNRRAPNDVRTNTIEALRVIRRMPRRVRRWISVKACALSRPKLTTKSAGIVLQGRVADDPLHAVDVEDSTAASPSIFVAGHLSADEAAIVGIAGEVSAVAIRDGERGSRRDALSGDVVGEPIQAETRDNDAAHPTIRRRRTATQTE